MDLFPPLFDGTLRAHYLTLFGAAGGIALVAGLASAWVGARIGARRAVRRAWEDTAGAQAARTDARLEELARGVDAIAIEVERIAEAQRFAARLTAEREARRAPGRLPSGASRTPDQVTPH